MLNLVNDWHEYIEQQDLDTHKSIRMHTNTGRPLAEDALIEKVEAITGRDLRERRTLVKLYEVTGRIITPLIRHLASRRKKTATELIEEQSRTLLRLVSTAHNTQFGRDHAFESISNIEDYQQHVPIRNYEQFWDEYWSTTFPKLENATWPGRIKYFAKTSGTTTGVSKFIPCTSEMIKANNRAGMRVIFEHLRNNPSSNILHGRYFMFAGSPNLEELAPNVFAGELSGIAAKETPFWAGRDRYYPPDCLSAIGDWQTKLERISEDCLDKDIRAIGGLPSWMQILFQRIFEQTHTDIPELARCFPKLELIIHGGMSFEPYRDYFLRIANGLEIDFREIYAASEGFFAIADRQYGDGMRLLADNGLFYEFIPLDRFGDDNPPRHWLGNIKPNIDYVLLVTSCAGLWSYVVGDIIRFTDTQNMRLIFSGRLSQTLSKFGEKVLNEEVESVLALVMGNHDFALNDFAVASIFDKQTDKGRHIYLVEMQKLPEGVSSRQLAREIDIALQEKNSGYATRRQHDVAILTPELVSLQPGTFALWMEQHGRAGGQQKVPRTISDKQLGELVAISRNSNSGDSDYNST